MNVKRPKCVMAVTLMAAAGAAGLVTGVSAESLRETAGGSAAAAPVTRAGHESPFTGEVKLVFYVSDVKKAVAFYRDVLGFTFHHYHDYDSGASVKTWTKDKPPIYAEMSYAGRRFGLHLPQSQDDERSVGRMKVYFRVKDLDAHYARVKEHGGKPGALRKKPWMDMFRVVDPDGHRIYFAYTEDAVHGNPWYGK